MATDWQDIKESIREKQKEIDRNTLEIADKIQFNAELQTEIDMILLETIEGEVREIP